MTALATLPVTDGISSGRCVFSGSRHDGTCGRDAVVTATVGCIHEHVYADLPVCQYHVEEVAEGDSYCRACFDRDGHDCPLLADPRGVRDLDATHPEAVGRA
ncbi:hypothetical protein [Nonomuraea bangladeshensis]|uniref:hypothetical protein n=1 Tax=Nonomuraea bangladeshensis TaxID=404385 RepID=UPI003C2ABE45